MVSPPVFPFFDSDDTLVREDRRKIADRRISSEQSDHVSPPHLTSPIDVNDLDDQKLFIWFNDEIHEVKRQGEGIWMGRSQDCFAHFDSPYVSRLHCRLFFLEGVYYLIDNSTNGTYIKHDDGEQFVTKDRIAIKGSGIISLGVPFSYSEKYVVHYFIG